MTYTVSSSEKLRKSGADAETKALLYLMNFHENHKDVHYFIVDFFNDLTGMDRMSDKLWDIQSKAGSNASPKSIGKELVTLYKNYVSEFEFESYILFVGGVSNTVRIDSSKNIFKIDNVNDKAIKKIKEGLIEECKIKTYISNSSIISDKIDEFLNKLLIVIDDKKPSEYVKAIINNHLCLLPDEDSLTAIFHEIRKIQSDKKNTNSVEGISIVSTDQSLNYHRHLTSGEIQMLVVGRIINRNPFEKGCPIPFIEIYNSFPVEKKIEALDDCKLSMSRALFNKNCTEGFWQLFSAVYIKIVQNPQKNVEEIFNLLDREVKRGCPDFDVLSLKYFIATVKEGVRL